MYTSPVFLDSCEHCGGVWIDNGELHQMRLYLEAAKTEGKRPASKVSSEVSDAIGLLSAAQQVRAQRAKAAAWLVAHKW